MHRCLRFILCLSLIMSMSVHAALEIEKPITQWRVKTEGPIRGGSVVTGERVYFGSGDGFVYAVDSNNGKLHWRAQTGAAIASTPALSGETLIVSNRKGLVVALSSDTGKVRWRFKMREKVTIDRAGWQYQDASPVIVANTVYLGSQDGHLYALKLKNGKLLWKFNTGSRITASPLIGADTVYQPSNDSRVYAIDMRNGKLKGRFETQGASRDQAEFSYDIKSIYTQPILRDGTLIIGARDGNTYGFNIDNYKSLWNISYGSAWAMSTTADNDTVYVGWSSNKLFSAADIKTGKERWKLQLDGHTFSKPLLSGSSLFFGNADGNLYQVNKDSGEINWRYSLDAEVHSAPTLNKKDNSILIGADNGYFYSVAQGQASHKIVYQPVIIEGNAQYVIADQKITPYFVGRGFKQLETDALIEFFKARIVDKESSVVVFALPIIPDVLIGTDPSKSLYRQYLAAGGKVLWFGDAPNFYAMDAEGNFVRSTQVAEVLLDVHFVEITESGNYRSEVSQLGRNMGLPAWLKTTATPLEPNGVEILAKDEFGRVSAWVKRFSSKPGSGHVSFRPWSWNVGIRERDLELIEKLALYGLE